MDGVKEVKDYEEFLITIGDVKANMFDDLLKIAKEDKKSDMPDEQIAMDLAYALYYYGRAIDLISEVI